MRSRSSTAQAKQVVRSGRARRRRHRPHAPAARQRAHQCRARAASSSRLRRARHSAFPQVGSARPAAKPHMAPQGQRRSQNGTGISRRRRSRLIFMRRHFRRYASALARAGPSPHDSFGNRRRQLREGKDVIRHSVRLFLRGAIVAVPCGDASAVDSSFGHQGLLSPAASSDRVLRRVPAL